MSSHEDAVEGRRLNQRRRALSERGDALFQDGVSTFSARLARLHQQLDELLSPSTNISLDELLCKHDKIRSLLSSYEKNSEAFMAYLERVNTKDSEREAVSHTLIAKTVLTKAHSVLRGYDVLEQSLSKCRSSTPQQSVVSSIKTHGSKSSSSLRTKAEVALARCNTELDFARRSADLKRAKAKAMLEQTNLDTDIELLEKSKMAAIANAELQAMTLHVGSDAQSEDRHSVFGAEERTLQYVIDQSSVNVDNLCASDTDSEFPSASGVNTEYNNNMQHDPKSSAVGASYFNELVNYAGVTDLLTHTPTATCVVDNNVPATVPVQAGKNATIKQLSSHSHVLNSLPGPSYVNVPQLVSSHSHVTCDSQPVVKPVHTSGLTHVNVNSADCHVMGELPGNNRVHNDDRNVTFSQPQAVKFDISQNTDVSHPNALFGNFPSSLNNTGVPSHGVSSVFSARVGSHGASDTSHVTNCMNNMPQMPGGVGSTSVVPQLATGLNFSVPPPTLGNVNCLSLSSPGPYMVPNSDYCSALSSHLLKKDLLLTRLTNFDDRAETYLTWKCTFKSVMSELSVNASEELDLLIRYLGKESAKSALSMKISNPRDPGRGLTLLWMRLDERFGSPELVEAALKSKLTKFPKVAQNQMKRLYDLSDILFEVESIMCDPNYQQLFAHYNTSAGIGPIVAKLPQNIQSKWMSRAMKYKSRHAVIYPPFSEFCAFVQEMTTWYNDPGFNPLNFTSPGTNQNLSPAGGVSRSVVSSRKTEVSHVGLKCPLHNADHNLRECRAFHKKPLSERKQILKQNHICFRCCDSDQHGFRDCQMYIQCSECGNNSHVTVMHVDSSASAGTKDKPHTGKEPQGGEPTTRATQVKPSSAHKPSNTGTKGKQSHGGESKSAKTEDLQSQSGRSVASKCTQVCGRGLHGRSCAKIVPVRVYPADQPDKAVKLYAILDDQSNSTLARSALLDAMDTAQVDPYQYTLSSCSGRESRSGRRAFGLVVESLDGEQTLKLPPVIECDDIPNEHDEIPTPDVASHFDHLTDITFAPLDPEAEILLLISRDMLNAHVVLEQRTGSSNDPFAQRLALGWVLVGNVCLGGLHPADGVVVAKTFILGDGQPTSMEPCPYSLHIKEKIQVFTDPDSDVFRRTSYDDEPSLSIEDGRFLQLMDQEFTRDQKGHWTAPLPF